MSKSSPTEKWKFVLPNSLQKNMNDINIDTSLISIGEEEIENLFPVLYDGNKFLLDLYGVTCHIHSYQYFTYSSCRNFYYNDEIRDILTSIRLVLKKIVGDSNTSELEYHPSTCRCKEVYTHRFIIGLYLMKTSTEERTSWQVLQKLCVQDQLS